MGPLKYKKNETQRKCSFPRQLFQNLYFLFSMCPASLKFKNDDHLGHISLKIMRRTLGTSI